MQQQQQLNLRVRWPLTSFLSNSRSEWSASLRNAVVKASPHQVYQEVESRHSVDELFVLDHPQTTQHSLYQPLNRLTIGRPNHTKRCRWFHPFEKNALSTWDSLHCSAHKQSSDAFSCCAYTNTVKYNTFTAAYPSTLFLDAFCQQ